MNQSSTAGILVGAYRGEQSGNTGTDVLTHDDRDRSAVGNLTGNRQSLQNTDGSGGGLDNTGQNSTGQHTQDGILEQQEQVGECGNISQTGNCVGHGIHTEHQSSKAQQDRTGILLLVALEEHVEDDTDKCKNGSKGSGIEQFYENIAAFNTAKAQDPRSNSGTDVGAHDNIDRLSKGHQAGVYKTDNHNGGSRRGLNNGCNTKTGQQTCPFVGGERMQNSTQRVACTAFQSVTHNTHAVEEKT